MSQEERIVVLEDKIKDLETNLNSLQQEKNIIETKVNVDLEDKILQLRIDQAYPKTYKYVEGDKVLSYKCKHGIYIKLGLTCEDHV